MRVINELSDRHIRWLNEFGPTKKRTSKKRELALDQPMRQLYTGLKQRLLDHHLSYDQHLSSPKQLGNYWRWLLSNYNKFSNNPDVYERECQCLIVQLETLLEYAVSPQGRANLSLQLALNQTACQLPALLTYLEKDNKQHLKSMAKSFLFSNKLLSMKVGFKAVRAAISLDNTLGLISPRSQQGPSLPPKIDLHSKLMKVIITRKLLKRIKDNPEFMSTAKTVFERIPKQLIKAALLISQDKSPEMQKLADFFSGDKGVRFIQALTALATQLTTTIDSSDISTLLFGQIISVASSQPSLAPTPTSAASSVSFDSDSDDDYRSALISAAGH